MIYLDNSATTPIDSRIREAMLPYLTGDFGNASSIYDLGRRARIALEDARAVVANAIGADDSEIIFTGSGTESDNHALKGAIFHEHLSGKAFSDVELVISSAEHHAVLHAAEFLQKFGVKLYLANVDSNGSVNNESLNAHLSDKTSLVSVMSVNNEVGSVNSIAELFNTVKSRSPKALFHTDAVQALGKIPINTKEWCIDLLTLSAHKIHGPKGIGALFIKRGVMIEPLMHGGAQERNRRGGTEAVALAVGFAKAVEIMKQEWHERENHIKSLYEFAISSLSDIPSIRINSPIDGSGVQAIINFSFTDDILQKIDGEALLIRFDLEGISVSNGSACTSGSMQPSHVLLAMGKGEEVASKSVRVSLSKETTKDHIEQFIKVLREILSRLA